MASTGKVACLGDDLDEAFLKVLLSVGYNLSLHYVLFSTGQIEVKADFLECARLLMRLGFSLSATPSSNEFLRENNVNLTMVYCPSDTQNPNIIRLVIYRVY